MRTLPNVVRRGAIFHFRRAVPKDLRSSGLKFTDGEKKPWVWH